MLEAILDAPLVEGPTQDARSDRRGHFACLEARARSKKGPPGDASTPYHYETTVRPLDPTEVQDWVWQKGRFRDNGPPDEGSGGGVRLLLAQPRGTFDRTVPQELLSARVLEGLRLPSCTFQSFQLASGAYSCHRYPQGSTLDDCSRLGIVFRSPQKWECSIGGLAICHDCETGMTTALHVGSAFGIDEFKTPSKIPSALEAFLGQFRASQHLMAHPLLLPCLLLASHVQLIRSYVLGILSQQVVHIEASIGVTTAGRSQTHDVGPPFGGKNNRKLFVNGQMDRGRARELMASLNDVSTWCIFAKRSPQWNIECIDALVRLLGENTRRLHKYRGIESGTFLETLECLKNYAMALLEVTQTSEARMQLQLNILYTSIAQDDGQTSARLALSAGKDSTSMKIIALITAAYLPGTFVATLFSMGMFSWRADGGGEEGNTGDKTASSLSPDFWIYWAVTVPLTIVTLAGWAVWWKFEEYRYDRDIRGADHIDTSQRASPRHLAKAFSLASTWR